MPKKFNKVSRQATVASILGDAIKSPKQPIQTTCVICNKEMPAARIQALKLINATLDRWTCVNCSTVTKVRGLYLGEVGTSKLQLCNKIYNDSVKSVFRRSESEDTDDPEENIKE
jgi:hypothetical protein